MSTFKYLLCCMDGFVFGASILRELGARPGYIYVVFQDALKKRHNRCVILMLGCTSILFISQLNFLELHDTFRFLGHSLAFVIMISVLCSRRATNPLIYFWGACSYLAFLFLSNAFPFFGDVLCSGFSQECAKFNVKFGISSEPSFLGVGVFLSLALVLSKFNSSSYYSKVSYSILYGLGIFVAFYVNSKTGMLAILISGLMESAFRSKFVFIVGSALALLALSLYASVLLDFSIDRSFLIRGYSSLCAIDLFLQNPIIGVGAGQYSYNLQYCSFFGDLVAVQEFTIGATDSRMSTYTLPTRIAAETGAFGLLIYIFSVFFVMSRVKGKSTMVCVSVGCYFGLIVSQDSYILAYVPVIIEVLNSAGRRHA